jgi:hypothetical protein
MFEDEIWDEDRWELYFRENDRRIDQYMDLLQGFLSACPLPESAGPEAEKDWVLKFREYLETRGIQPEQTDLAFFLDDEDDDEEDDSWAFDADEDDGDADDGDFRELPIYQAAFGLAMDVLDWANHLPSEVKDSNLVQFCAHALQISTNIARGHSLGQEIDVLGGNIACAKRALAAANSALDHLREMKEASYLEGDHYLRLAERTYEMRNELGIYVQELRQRFNLGID